MIHKMGSDSSRTVHVHVVHPLRSDKRYPDLFLKISITTGIFLRTSYR